MHHHCLWQVELLQLPQEVQSLLGLFGDGADVQLPLEVLGDGGAQETRGLHSVPWVSHRVTQIWVNKGGGGGGLFLCLSLHSYFDQSCYWKQGVCIVAIGDKQQPQTTWPLNRSEWTHRHHLPQAFTSHLPDAPSDMKGSVRSVSVCMCISQARHAKVNACDRWT